MTGTVEWVSARSRTHVLLVHGDHDARAGLVARLSDSAQVALSGDTSTAADALVALAARDHDVVMTGVRLPDGSADEVVRRARSRDRPMSVVVLLDPDAPGDVADAIRAGADGITDADTADASVALAVRDLAPGSCLLHRRAALALAAMCPPDPQALLSRREIDVLECLADDLTNAQIAARLFVSRETVKTHVAHLLRKLEVASRGAAVQRGRLLALLPAPDLPSSSADDRSSTHGHAGDTPLHRLSRSACEL